MHAIGRWRMVLDIISWQVNWTKRFKNCQWWSRKDKSILSAYACSPLLTLLQLLLCDASNRHMVGLSNMSNCDLGAVWTEAVNLENYTWTIFYIVERVLNDPCSVKLVRNWSFRARLFTPKFQWEIFLRYCIINLNTAYRSLVYIGRSFNMIQVQNILTLTRSCLALASSTRDAK